MIYKFRAGQTYMGVDPQTAGDELERIRLANGGKLLPQDVVEWAAESDSPLHGVFTWDTERAAREYNLQEARHLIRAVVVVVKENEVPQPAFWNILVSAPAGKKGEKADRYYQSAAVVANDPHEYDAALRGMLRELAAAQHGLEQLRRLAPRGTKTVIDRATGQVKAAHSALEKITPSK